MASSHHGDSSTVSTPRAVASNVLRQPPLPAPAPAPAPLAAAATPEQAQVQANGGPRVRLMTSFGGGIVVRPGDRRLRYLGETRIVTFPRAAASYATLVAALARVAPDLYAPGAPRPTIKYKLPPDDFDTLITVASDDDVDHLMRELDHVEDLTANVAEPARLRAFLFTPQRPGGPVGSILSAEAGSEEQWQWFIDALNAAAPHPSENGRSESSMSSDVPELMFHLELDNSSDERNPATTATNNNSGAETLLGGDDPPPPAPFQYASPPQSSQWPALPPVYVEGQPVYYYDLPPPPVRSPLAQESLYMPRPVYSMVRAGGSQALGLPHAAPVRMAGGEGSQVPGLPHAAPLRMVGGGGSQVPVHPYYAAPLRTGGGTYSVTSPFQPFPPPMLYAPLRMTVYPAGAKPPSENGTTAASTPESSP